MSGKKILIIGGTGMLGHKLIQVLEGGSELGTIIRADREASQNLNPAGRITVYDGIDVAEFGSVENVVDSFEPDFIVNAVGIVKQLPASKKELLTLDINSIFPQRLARIAQARNCRLITISTDCVFTGKKGNYSEDDLADAEDLYGKSKFLGEVSGRNCLTVRTSIIGRELASAHSLVEWFLGNRGKIVRGYKNAIYSGFPTIILAEIISEIIEKHSDLEGLYHVSSDPISKYDLLELVEKEFDPGIEIEPFEDFYIDRSLDSTKFRKATGFQPLSWEEMIKRMADDPTPYDKWRNQRF